VRADLQLGGFLAIRPVGFLDECPAHGCTLLARNAA
jgi:hypothetical protein